MSRCICMERCCVSLTLPSPVSARCCGRFSCLSCRSACVCRACCCFVSYLARSQLLLGVDVNVLVLSRLTDTHTAEQAAAAAVRRGVRPRSSDASSAIVARAVSVASCVRLRWSSRRTMFVWSGATQAAQVRRRAKAEFQRVGLRKAYGAGSRGKRRTTRRKERMDWITCLLVR